MADCSPGKWHLAHTSWFFEAMILADEPGYRPVDPRLQTLFNSYYETLGPRVDRPLRGLMTRPSLDEVLAYRREIDRRMAAWLGEAPNDARRLYLFTLGLHHDQQHQELFLMDILNLMAASPLDPAAFATEPRACPAQPARGGTNRFDGGLVEIGHAGPGFAFDNEGPAHRVWLEPYALANDLTTNADWIAFMDDGGYSRPELWLSDGWATVQAQGWQAPLYWQCEGGHWTTMGLSGRTPVAPASPVRHISFYEADAFARWAGKRLPGEAEWEHAVRCRPEAFANAFGEVWQWTASAYAPYPGFRPTEGTASEYNGKFMANQMVLRGSSFATPDGHARVSYRNFFYPHQRWAFTGLHGPAAGRGCAGIAGPVRRSGRDGRLPPRSGRGTFPITQGGIAEMVL
jgi:ergothioneine biosynthesis protein EgtB